MPVYEYFCDRCEIVKEVNKRVRDRDTQEFCPGCGNVSQRQISLGNFHLKGGGWEKHGYTDSSKCPGSNAKTKVLRSAK